MNIIPTIGQPLITTKHGFLFAGGKTMVETQGQQVEQAKMGLYLTSDYFSGGEIRATFRHENIDEYSCSEIILAYNPETKDSLHVGIPRDLSLISLRAWSNGRWETIAAAGDRIALVSGKDYEIHCVVRGSQVSVFCNGVKLIQSNLPYSISKSQCGLFFIGTGKIEARNFQTISTKPKAFVIMQFSSPYNEVYTEVIKSVCADLNVEVMRIDESMGPSLIIADIVQGIETSAFIIADISPVNANVFYEVGYAHGIKKPTILIAERNTKLPFDVSPIRTLFYDNSISGKPKLEKGLRDYIRHILGDVK